MRKSRFILLISVLTVIISAWFLLYFDREFDEAHHSGATVIYPVEEYAFSTILSIIRSIIPAFLLGFLISLIIRKRDKAIFITSIICFCFAGYSLYKTAQIVGRTNHYKKNEVNKEYNRGLAKESGGFLGVCLNLIMDDIEHRGILPNDYRIISYSYDRELVTIPEDTTKTFYTFSLIYRKKTSSEHRATAYLINFKRKIKLKYDVDIKHKQAEKQVNEIKELYKNMKEFEN